MVTKKEIKKLKLSARISGTILLLIILPLYLGGYPLPSFSLSFFENLWLIIIPIFLAGFIIGWKWEKLAGYTITIPIILGFVISIIVNKSPAILMALPLIPGILYLTYYYQNNKLNTKTNKKFN
ncbi:MAG: hypothetical protein PF488_03810 [Patescibacteria group bacterium]|jgi:uncharacterized membrane protein|nr:hypothetical protein [Patescibacteria group bacterium]